MRCLIAVLLSGLFLFSTIFSAGAESATEKGGKTWEGETIEHAGFRDLGNYVIELPDYTDPATAEKGMANVNKCFGKGEISTGGCTCMMTTNSKGEVIVGRNMDIEISQFPAYVYKTTFGKYKNFGVTYDAAGEYLHYAEVQKLDDLDEEWKNSLIYRATDCLNEKGLYIQTDLREADEKFVNYGLHSAHGEKTREDGTPWSELRLCIVAIPMVVSQNCATVDEAVAFLKNSYDWYSIKMPGHHFDQINFCFMIGDATGKYGLIEIAQDEISFLPYQFGQSNYYITPRWNALDTRGIGVGRLAKAYEMVIGLETPDEAMEAMKPIMWRNETLWIGESARVEDEEHSNPWDQIVFQDDKGNPQLDWRSEFAWDFPVLDDGRLIASAKVYADAAASTYDPKIKEYFDDAIARGTLVVDDGSFLFDVDGKQVTLTELKEKYDAWEKEKKEELKPYYDEYTRLLRNLSKRWVHDDHNFEALKAMAYARLHIRYNEKGEVDSTLTSKYEKLLTFYGYGVEKNEKPLRDDASIWTTSLNIGVNCAEKIIKVRFWENDDVIYEAGF